MRKSSAIALAVVAGALVSIIAVGQPSGGGGLRYVSHGSGLIGSGTTGSGLDLMHCVSAGAVLKWNSTGSGYWECGTDTGFTTAGTGVSASGVTVNVGATAGGMIAVAADTIGLDGSGCTTGQVPTYGSAGTWACATPAAGSGGGSAGYGSGLGSGSATVVITTMAGSVNLSTLGLVDWVWQGALQIGAGTKACTIGSMTNCHMKLDGGGLLANLGVENIHVSATSSFPSLGSTITTTAGDDLSQSALSASNGAQGLTKTTSGYGLRETFPGVGGNIQRVGRMYLFQDSSTITCTLHTSDASFADVTQTSVLVGTATASIVVTATYTTNTATYVSLYCIATTVNSTTSKLAWYGSSLGFI